MKCQSNFKVICVFLFIKVPVSIHESEQSCICVLMASGVPISTIFLLDVGTIPTVCHFFFVFSLFFFYSLKKGRLNADWSV